ncbi:Protein EMBRYONIC FLOWER like [Actinidia chinensis var. chinensis]|uniref:Protein EMBRYONIC FLOWER like n=1 Tax=Actinidia chinensis var. chinensis TaxID=1590841 RepID=A0A2R6PJH4_ACTCC|nr:Protein EMBRYONIC FLOWER like [Actinidia chinensis var. chinensis]
MEMSVVAEEHHQRSDSTPLSKSSGSVIRIDTISIDLTGAVETHQEARNCEHFSIRGYVAEMRNKDVSICFPFASESNQNKSEEQQSMLPPLHVAKFRWWRCQNCRREIGAMDAAEDIEMVPDRARIGFISTGTCSHMQSASDAAMVVSDLQKVSELDNFEGRKTVVDASTNVIKDEIRLSLFGYNKEKKHEDGQASGSGDGVNQEKCIPMCDIPESNPCLIQKRYADGLDVLGSKSSTLGEFCRQSSKIHAASDVQSLECTGKSSAEVYQTGKSISAYGEQKIASMACETPKLFGRTSESICFVKGPTTKFPSLDLEENDIQCMDSPSSLIRPKPRKVRLLTELLGSKGNEENDRARAEGGPSRIMPNMPARLDTSSALHGQIVVQESPKKSLGGPKGKRKMSQDEESEPLELICPSKLSKKARVFKGAAEITHKNTVIADCESEEDPSARVDIQSGARSQSTRHKVDRNPMPSKKKKKQTQLEGGYFPSMPQGGFVLKTNQTKIGDAEKYSSSAADVGFPKSKHEGFINSRMEPHFRSSLSPQQAERKTNLCKKSKQVGLGQASLIPQRTNMLGEGSVPRKGLDIMETEHERIKLQSAHGATARQGSNLSLSSYGVACRNERSGIDHTVNGSDPISTQLMGTPREDPHQRKDIVRVGESSGSHKPAPDIFFRKGLLCDLNEKIAVDRTSPLHEMQSLVPRIESKSLSRHQQSNFFSARNSENTAEVQEQGNDDIPMEIVELMARCQYERCRQESGRNFCLSEQTDDKRDAQLTSFPRVRGNGMLNPESGMGMVTTGQNAGLIKRNPTNCFSVNPFNMGKREGNSSFPGFSAFSRFKEMQSGGVQIPDSGSIGNINPQNGKWKGDKIERRFSPTKIPVLEVHNSCQNRSRRSEEAEHVRSSLILNHVPFGYGVPQKHVPQSSNFEMHSQFPKTQYGGRMTRDLDLNYMKLHANDLGKQNMNFDSESFRRASSEFSFLCKHREIDLNAKVSGPLDPQSNETIPAMQLLSLMDAGVQSSPAFNLDGKPKFFTKPFFPCDHHPKVGLDGTSKMLEKPLFPYDHRSKQGTVVHNDSSRRQSVFYGKNHPLEKSCECSPAVPTVGAFVSPFQSDGSRKRGTGFTGQVSLKSEERGKAPMQNRGSKSQKSASTSGISRRGRESKTIQDNQKGIIGASNATLLPSQHYVIEDSTTRIDLKAYCANGTVFPTRSVSKNEVCSLNRNPADFSIPEAGNLYMISGKDLKFGKKLSRGRPAGMVNVDGRKRQRATKHTAMERH